MRRRFPKLPAAAATAVIAFTLPAAAVELPVEAPLPQPNPRAEAPSEPSPSPADNFLETAPVPSPRHEETPGLEDTGENGAEAESVAAQSDGLPAHERACRARLRELGVEHVATETIAEEEGCAIAWPVSVSALSPDIDLVPDATLNCAMAETTARFFREIVTPAARRHLGAEPETVRHASAYVCRPRSGASKLSEHAFGNALDISAIVLTDGTELEVGRHENEDRRKLQAEIRERACGPFKTVLGPGSDANHATHFHLDLAKRPGGATYCR